MRVRKVVHRQKVKVISPEREDRKVKTRNESKKTNFMTILADCLANSQGVVAKEVRSVYRGL